MANKGKLYIVSTPIGNLGDISQRAKEILSQVEYIASEDTREIGQLLKLLGIGKKKYISYRDQNHDRVLPQIIEILDKGVDIALVADRGTPTISDPGLKLVRDLLDKDYEVVSIPGPTAAVAALSISGLPTDKFVFLGFLPRKKGKQQKILEKFRKLPATFIIYESPFRLIKTLENIKDSLGNIDIAVAHEITKIHEGIIKGKIDEILLKIKGKKIKGEWVIIGKK